MRLILFFISFFSAWCCFASEDNNPPIAEIFLLDKQTQSYKIQNNTLTDLTVNIGETILIQCRGLGKSVQIIYNGYGVPVLSSNTSVIEDENNGTYINTAVLQLADVKEDFSGQYKCIYSESPEIFSSFHIYIPGKRIFTIAKGREILFSISDSQATIPCPVSSKSVTVQLKRVENGVMQEALNSTVAPYDPRRGFTLYLSSLLKSFESNEDFGANIEGKYICEAHKEGEMQIIEFTLMKFKDKVQASGKPASGESGSNERISNPCKAFRCASHEDCKVYDGHPKCVCKPYRRGSDCTLGCVTDRDCLKHQKCEKRGDRIYECVSRCVDHICGKNSECQYDEEGNPTCVCKNGYSRNSTSSDCNSIAIVSQDVSKNYCNPSRCGPFGKCQLISGKNTCTCVTGAVGTPPNCSQGCGADSDCPLDKKCSPLGECVNVCKEKNCGERALCRTLRRKPICYCPIGYSGDPSIACYSSVP